MLKASEDAKSLIRASEGTHYAVYFDGAGHATAGVGHKLKPHEHGLDITEVQVEEWFAEDIDEAERTVRSAITVPLTQGQFDALVSFAFNFGATKFNSYSLKELINNRVPVHEVASRWMQYIYTITDRDKDGDKDAVIDRGLPIRRLREWLMYRGFSWPVVEAAANSNNIQLQKEKISWGANGFKEVMLNTADLILDAIDRARSLAAFLDEPDDYLFSDDPDPEELTREAVSSAPVADDPLADLVDPTPETPLTMADIQYQSAQAAGYEGSYADWIGHRVIVSKRNAIQAPKVDLAAPPKAMEDSETARQYAKEISGRDDVRLATIMTGASATAGVASGLSKDVSTMMENTRTIIGGATLMQLVTVGLCLGVPFLIYGLWKMYRGRDGKEHGRAIATQPKV